MCGPGGCSPTQLSISSVIRGVICYIYHGLLQALVFSGFCVFSISGAERACTVCLGMAMVSATRNV